MNPELRAFLDELYEDGLVHDGAQPDRLSRRRNLEPASAELVSFLVRIMRAGSVVEIGTANGYSTLWLADAVSETGGLLVSVDTATADDAVSNLARADDLQSGLSERVDFRTADGGDYLRSRSTGSVDLLFLDAERVEYTDWWPHPLRVLSPGGVLVVDNVLSHPGEVAAFLALLADSPEVSGLTVPVGKGLHLVRRRMAGFANDS